MTTCPDHPDAFAQPPANGGDRCGRRCRVGRRASKVPIRRRRAAEQDRAGSRIRCVAASWSLVRIGVAQRGTDGRDALKDTTYTVSLLVQSIGLGKVALPDIQRPFVWQAGKVRALFDSMYKGFP